MIRNLLIAVLFVGQGFTLYQLAAIQHEVGFWLPFMRTTLELHRERLDQLEALP